MQAQSNPHRLQLIEGLCLAVEDKGYATTTIADVVGHARVSKRTFYEQFADKEECFLAAYRELADQTMQAIAQAVELDAPWEQQIDAAVRSYLAVLDARPALTRTFFLEIQAAGTRGLALRREVMDQFMIVAKKKVPITQRLSSSESAVFCWTTSATASARIPIPMVAKRAPSAVIAIPLLGVSPRAIQK